jgi:hypothetical protein
MSDRERIQALVAEGKITQEEADNLLAALADVDGVAAEMDAFEAAVAAEHASAAPETPPSSTPGGGERASGTAAAPTPRESASPAASASQALPGNLRWVHVKVMAGDLDIRSDPSIGEPVISGSGTVNVAREGEDFVVSARRRHEVRKEARREGLDGVLDGVIEGISDFVSGVVNSVGDLDIRVPAGYGVVVHSKAGDVDVRGVPFVKAHMLAGDLDLRDVGGVDLSMTAGDVDAELRLTEGEHRVKVSAGDVDIRLLEGSSVTVEGRVSMGDLDAQAPFAASRSGVRGQVSGRLGDGTARLELWVSAGDLDVRRA